MVLKLGQKSWKVHMGNLLVSLSSAQNNKTGFNNKARDAKGAWRTHFALRTTQAYMLCFDDLMHLLSFLLLLLLYQFLLLGYFSINCPFWVILGCLGKYCMHINNEWILIYHWHWSHIQYDHIFYFSLPNIL